MLTENYKKIIYSLANGNRDVRLTNVDGISISFNSASPFANAINQKIIVGSGTTPATSADYSLADPLEIVVNTDICVDNIKMYLAATIYNNTQNEVNINEVGRTLNTSATEVLISRKVLNTPITIGAGETKTITYEIGF